MTDRNQISHQMQTHYEAVWQEGDAWSLENSEFEQRRYDYMLGLIKGRRYGRVLEIGCGSGCFTRLLAGVSDRVVAIDIAPAAVERARARTANVGADVVDVRVADAMQYEPAAEGPWDLVVLSETIYCMAWLYPLFDVAWFAARLFNATCPGGRFLLTNTFGQEGKDWLLAPWLIHTYRDLIRNVGYRLEMEEIFRGTKEGVDFRVLLSLFTK
jgi:SAM-dependent methyltransferase